MQYNVGCCEEASGSLPPPASHRAVVMSTAAGVERCARFCSEHVSTPAAGRFEHSATLCMPHAGGWSCAHMGKRPGHAAYGHQAMRFAPACRQRAGSQPCRHALCLTAGCRVRPCFARPSHHASWAKVWKGWRLLTRRKWLFITAVFITAVAMVTGLYCWPSGLLQQARCTFSDALLGLPGRTDDSVGGAAAKCSAPNAVHPSLI